MLPRYSIYLSVPVPGTYRVPVRLRYASDTYRVRHMAYRTVHKPDTPPILHVAYLIRHVAYRTVHMVSDTVNTVPSASLKTHTTTTPICFFVNILCLTCTYTNLLLFVVPQNNKSTWCIFFIYHIIYLNIQNYNIYIAVPVSKKIWNWRIAVPVSVQHSSLVT